MKLRTIRPTAKIRRKKPPVKLNATAARRPSRVQDFEEEEEDYYESSEPNMKLSHAFIVVLILHLIAVAGVFGFNSMKNRQAAIAKITAESGAAQSVAETVNDAAATTARNIAGADAAAGTASSGEPASHIVAAGDTLTRIAAKYNTTIEELEKANGLTAESILRVGQSLALPVAGAAVAATPGATGTSAPAGQAVTGSPASTTPPAPTAAKTTASAPPAPAPAVASATPAQQSAAPAEATPDVYEVVAGDNPYSIARRLGVSYQSLLEVNNITDPTKLQIGQKLKVPGR